MREINNANLTIDALLIGLIQTPHTDLSRYRDDLLKGLPNILNEARSAETSIDIVRILEDFYCNKVKDICSNEIRNLTNIQTGFHLNAKNLNPEKLEIFNLKPLLNQYRTQATRFWDLITCIFHAHPRSGVLRQSSMLSEEASSIVNQAGSKDSEADGADWDFWDWGAVDMDLDMDMVRPDDQEPSSIPSAGFEDTNKTVNPTKGSTTKAVDSKAVSNNPEEAPGTNRRRCHEMLYSIVSTFSNIFLIAYT